MYHDTHQSPSIIVETIIISNHVPATLSTTLEYFFLIFDVKWLISLIAFRQFLKLNEGQRRLATIPCLTPCL
jgi:hypothetical protein